MAAVQAADDAKRASAHAKNDLESYIIATRGGLNVRQTLNPACPIQLAVAALWRAITTTAMPRSHLQERCHAEFWVLSLSLRV